MVVKSTYLYAGLLMLTVAAYLPALGNGFVDIDDEVYITKNPAVLGGLTWDNVRWACTTFHSTYWHPLTWLSLQADAHFFSESIEGAEPVLDAAACHAQNVLWHAGSVLLLFGLWRRLTGATWRSFAVAALFSLHPMRVESVAWAVERKDVMCVFFGIAALWAYVRYLEAPSWGRYSCILAAYLLSLLAKPMLVTFPFALLLLDFWPLRRLTPVHDGLAPASWPRVLVEKLPFVIMAAATVAMTLVARRHAGTAVPLSELPFTDRTANAIVGYGQYLLSTIWPFGLAVLYPHPRGDWSLVGVAAGAGALLAITAICFRQASRRPWLIMGWSWFVGTLIPVIGFFQGGEQAWADRFSYWPHIGLFVALAWGLSEICERLRAPVSLQAALGGFALAGLGLLTWIQAGYWRDSVTLWERTASVTRDNHVAQIHLARHYLDQGRPEKAVVYAAEAVRILPDAAVNRFMLGQVLLQLGKPRVAEVEFRAVVRRKPADIDAWHNLGVARLRQEKDAAYCFRKVLQSSPDSADAAVGLGLALLQEGKLGAAITALQTALRHNSKEAEAWCGLGFAKLMQGKSEEAIAGFSEALRLNPQMMKAQSGLGVAFGREGQWTRAVQTHQPAVQLVGEAEKFLRARGYTPPRREIVAIHCRLAFALNRVGDFAAAREVYQAALRRDPDWPRHYLARAWELATRYDRDRRDPRMAFELASQALEAVGNSSAAMLDVLAATKAALGDFPAAIDTARQALAKISAGDGDTLSAAIRERLHLYEHGESYAAPDKQTRDPELRETNSRSAHTHE